MFPKPSRPIGITLLSILFVWNGGGGTLFFPIFILAGASGLVAKLIETELHRSHWLSVAISSLLFIILFAGNVLYLCIGIGLWKLRRWALKAIIAVHWFVIGAAVLASLIILRYDAILALGSAVWCGGIMGCFLWYLTRPGVRWPFEATYAAAHGLAIPAPPPPSNTATWVKVSVGVGIVVTIILVFILSLWSFIEKELRSSDVYQQAMQQAQHSPCVAVTLGTPIVSKGSVSGSMSTQGDSGEAELEIPIRGPKAEGSLRAEATKTDGKWNFTDLTVDYAEGQIHLQPVPSSCQ